MKRKNKLTIDNKILKNKTALFIQIKLRQK